MLDGTARLGLVVTDVKVEGRETTDRETILAALGAGPGTPILAMSPRRAKEQLETLPWVRSAVVERRLPDTVYVRLVERKPLALWQHSGKLELIDHDGGVIPVMLNSSTCWQPSPISLLASMPLSGSAAAVGTCASTMRSMSSFPPIPRRPAGPSSLA
jgi:cell division protein FtsQ